MFESLLHKTVCVYMCVFRNVDRSCFIKAKVCPGLTQTNRMEPPQTIAVTILSQQEFNRIKDIS